MLFRKANLLPLAAMAASAAMFMACNDSPTGPQATTSAEARADLQTMAAKVKYFAPQKPSPGMGPDGAAKRGAAKVGARLDVAPGCEQDATQYDTWDTDTSATGDITVQYDTTVSYTAANRPVCAFDDMVAYDTTRSRSENSMLESHFVSRTDYPADFFTGDISLTGNGTVNYRDGYLIAIPSMNIVINFGKGTANTFVMNLVLEKGYTVALKPAPGNDPLSQEKPDPKVVQDSGPIMKDGTVVGYFEVMGDDSVVIRDAAKAVIESHG